MADNDDQREWHTVEHNLTQFTVPKRYQNLSPFEYNSHDIVTYATDTNTGKKVTIRKILKPFDSVARAHRTYRELKLRIHLNHFDAQVAQLYDVFTSEKDLNNFETLYLVENYVEYDLKRVIYSNVVVTEDHIKMVIYCLLRGLKFIHSAGIIHSRIISSNIGIDKDSNVSIFGWDSAATAHIRRKYDEHWLYNESDIYRRWYAPEMIINPEHCNEKVDIWSVGCIMAELIVRQPLFPGTSQSDQLTKIFDITGTPDSKTLDEMNMPSVVRQYCETLSRKPKQDYEKLFGYKYNQGSETPVSGVSSQGVTLLDRLLLLNHCMRPTAEELLNDPYFEMYHDPIDEPSSELLIDEYQDATYSTEKWKSITWNMVKGFVPPPWTNENIIDKS
ncbi:unnamed protein product [Rotaria sordida]|uniref:Protein kinase domain-containing protein n=1 Tax=Rotaria sordida TaxID=392033 RepID=A0A814FXL3_9BILA|nr:unnamed protein product [Rotaria sordida]